jgi:glycosyltransferase involved in cell wall biosynthesis
MALTIAARPPDFSIVLPARNEVANIAPMVAALREVLAPLGRFEIIYIDDGSDDGTLTLLREAAAVDASVRYLSLTRNFGHEAAIRAGLSHARGRAVIVMDADLEHPPALIADLVKEWRRGFKIVTAQRVGYEMSVPWLKRATSRLYYRVLDTLGDIHIEPGSANFMLLDRVVVDAVNRIEDQDLFPAKPAPTWRQQVFAQPHDRACRHRHRAAQRAAAAVCDLARARLCRTGWPVRGLLDHELLVRAAHSGRLDLDHGGDRHPGRCAAPRAWHCRRICRAHPARDPQAAELCSGGDRGRPRSRS